MGYYTIRILPAIQYVTTIVTKYNSLPMGMCNLGDIFQSKVDNLPGDIEGTKTYINNILVSSKKSLSKHIEQLSIIFGILRVADLKVNAPKCSFWLKEIPYLGYEITREEVKPGPNKVQGIMDLTKPTTTTESRALIDMFQY